MAWSAPSLVDPGDGQGLDVGIAEDAARAPAGRGVDGGRGGVDRDVHGGRHEPPDGAGIVGLVRDAADLHHVRVGTVRDAVAVGYLDREGIHHQDFTTIEDGLRTVAAGQLDAAVYDKPILAWLVRQDHPNELQVLGLNLDPLSYAIAFPFDSPLRRKLNIALVNTMRSSWWREVVKRNLGAE
jgi:ABC-type amino acid transport substrate-binding protein